MFIRDEHLVGKNIYLWSQVRQRWVEKALFNRNEFKKYDISIDGNGYFNFNGHWYYLGTEAPKEAL